MIKTLGIKLLPYADTNIARHGDLEIATIGLPSRTFGLLRKRYDCSRVGLPAQDVLFEQTWKFDRPSPLVPLSLRRWSSFSQCAERERKRTRKNVRTDRTLPLLCDGQRIPANAPATQEEGVRVRNLRPPGDARRFLLEVPLLPVPRYEAHRQPLPNLRRSAQTRHCGSSCSAVGLMR